MKKIIELAEKVTEVFDHPWNEYLEAVNAMKTALAEREALEQTPITEDWLKEHGFEFKIEQSQPYVKEMKDWYISFVADINLLCVEKYKDRHLVCRMQKRDATLADLYDALDLCGIKID